MCIRDRPAALHLWCYACASCSGYYPLNPPCVHCLCCCCTNSGACPVWPRPVCLGHYRPLQRRSASDKCSVRCRPMKQREKIYRNFWSKPTFDKVHFCPFFKNVPQKLPSGQFLEKYILKNVLSQTLYSPGSWKTSAVSTTVWMVETQLCKLRGT